MGKSRRVDLSSQSLLSCDTAPQVYFVLIVVVVDGGGVCRCCCFFGLIVIYSAALSLSGDTAPHVYLVVVVLTAFVAASTYYPVSVFNQSSLPRAGAGVAMWTGHGDSSDIMGGI